MKKPALFCIQVSTLGALVWMTHAIATPSNTPQAQELDPLRLAGDASVMMKSKDAFFQPMAKSSRAHRRSFRVGHSLFNENWVVFPASVNSLAGLGPLINSQSCSTCHARDGRGQPPLTERDSMTSMLVRLSIPGEGPHGEPVPVPNYGDQLRHRANVGIKTLGDVKVKFSEVAGQYPDGTNFSLARPTYTFEGLNYGELPKDVMISPRVAPQVIGLGLLETIPENAILASVDVEDKNGDGISGKANLVWDPRLKKKRLGRFGWKANQPDLHAQNAGAFSGDMGLTSSTHPHQNCPPSALDCLNAPASTSVEVSDANMKHMETYMKTIAVPMRRNGQDPKVIAGHRAFQAAKCQACHTETFKTGVDKEFPELSRQKIHPFTDLLLHDMGPGLADGRPDFLATGQEWRTPPLWGIGLIQEINGHTRFLHDGRARNLEEAILWHGGEAETSKNQFMAMSKADRSALIQFLESL